jgi:hypothetical protein
VKVRARKYELEKARSTTALDRERKSGKFKAKKERKSASAKGFRRERKSASAKTQKKRLPGSDHMSVCTKE